MSEPTLQMTADQAKARFGTMQQAYKDTQRAKGFNVLIGGDRGTGKTTFSITGRRPVLIHSFDPDGTESVRDEIEAGWVYANTTFEDEDPTKPSVFIAWEAELRKLHKEGLFDHIGTYVIDSSTTLGTAALYEILKRKGRPGGVPQQDDWLPQMVLLENAFRFITSLPCDVVVTAHMITEKDEVSGKVYAYPLITGKLKVRIPILFTESYIAMTKEKPNGIERYILTQPTGIYTASTRLGRKNRFDLHEKPNIKHLLNKAGLSAEDKGGI